MSESKYLQIDVEQEINGIIAAYNSLVFGINNKAMKDENGAYGGIIRAGKGELVENIAKHLIELSWYSLGGNLLRLEINSMKIPIPINVEYVKKIADSEIREYILKNIDEYSYGISVDKQVFIDSKFILGMECKAYTENAMMKRILFDFHLIKTRYPNISCFLLQLESQLGGDFSELNEKTYGSQSTHTLMSFMPEVDLKIITLLKGERKVDEPIHQVEFRKQIEKKSIYFAISEISKGLEKYL